MGIAAEIRTVPTQFEQNNTRVLFMMAAALGRRDSYTHAHAQRVAAYSRRLGLCAELGGQTLLNVTLGGMLHDVGKLALSDRIFSNKQAALSKEMLGEVQTHPLIGAELLRQTNCNNDIFQAVLYHHERIDGSGYPFGLKDDEIPLGAKIVSVADCLDAITTDRPYQRRKTLAHAFIILKKMAGTCLDENLVALMLADIQAKGLEPVMPRSNAILQLL